MTSRSRASGCCRCCSRRPTSRSSASAATAGRRCPPSSSTRPTWCSSTCRCPGCDGFEVIRSVGADRMPTVVFVTAYDEYALQAFEVHALDYLLKPFGKDRFQQTLPPRARGARTAPRRRSRPPPARARPRRQAGGAAAGGAAGREVRRPRLLSPDRRDRLDRGGRQLRAAAPRRRVAPVPRDDEPHGIAPRFPPLRPHPPLPHRQHRADQGDAALVQRRLHRHPARRHAIDAQPRLPRPGPAETRR